MFFAKLVDLWQDAINTLHNDENDDDKDENIMTSCLEQCAVHHIWWDNKKQACNIATSNVNDQRILTIDAPVLELDVSSIDNELLTSLARINNDDNNDNKNDSNNEIFYP